MNSECRNFRARLADVLRGPLGGTPVLGGSTGLGWHAHVIHCEECRELLSEEEALDELLRSLPQPHLPRALAERVLSRLDAVRSGVELDRLLDLQKPEPAPANLARSVIARVHAEAQLDRLLERVPAAKAPVGLERRVLARLELTRRAKQTPVRNQRAAAVRNLSSAPAVQPPWSRLSLRIAAGFALVSLAAWGAWSLRRAILEQPRSVTPEIVGDPAHVNSMPEVAITSPTQITPAIETLPATQPDDALLASLEMFEAWDLLSTGDGVDASLSTLDSLDEYLLDFESAPSTADGATLPAAPGSAGSSPGADSDSKNMKKNG